MGAQKRSRGVLMTLKKELSGVFKQNGVELEQQFRGFDTNGDGAIDRDEFRNGLHSLGSEVSHEQVEDLIMILDTDGDGEVCRHSSSMCLNHQHTRCTRHFLADSIV
jgi:Ca2+-binding EF-hand superfamily protein